MLITTNVRSAVEQIWVTKTRSLLTIVGMIIAVSSTITVVSVVRGFSGFVAEFLQGMGTNSMWVWPQRPAGDLGRSIGRVEMSIDDVEEVDRWCTALMLISPVVRQSSAVIRSGNDDVTTVV